ncbi:MAG TPA: thiamine pyrophosphate-binding protein [Holophaga sp.]|nr:thiamine pyrophosphate-binding protein [Holophaga sp.]
MEQTTVGNYLAQRLLEAGIQDFFAVPGDFNLALLDELIAHPGLRMVTCCNELNAGYAADGYARARGAAALVVTFAVGGLSAVNAVAGAYAEDLPVVVVSGGPNALSLKEGRTLHHTLARPGEGETWVRDLFRPITAATFLVRDPEQAPRAIDGALLAALKARKPVYLEIACNLARESVSLPHPMSVPPAESADALSQEAAASHASAFLNLARQPVLVAGSLLRCGRAVSAFRDLAERSGYGVACMPDAKGLFPEDHPQYLGIYWGTASSPGCREVVEASDAYLFAGARFNDYTTLGYSTLLQRARMVQACPRHACVGGQSYQGLLLPEFLGDVAGRLKPNPAALEAFRRDPLPGAEPVSAPAEAPLAARDLYARIQAQLAPGDTLVADTGDAWFQAMALRLPEGSRFEIQMQYGAIGWSVGALLGLGVADRNRRLLGLVGDGCFQMAAQELGTILRERLRGLIVILNNGAYAIEAMIHDGPYNDLQAWRYAALAEAMAAGAPLVARRVTTLGELDGALAEAGDFPGLTVLEAVLDRADCSRALLGWGAAVSGYNARKE